VSVSIGILATQSNDFALGLPIFKVLYTHSHPSYPLLLYVIAPISLVIINPIAFCMCEYGFSLTNAHNSDECKPTEIQIEGKLSSADSLKQGAGGGSSVTVSVIPGSGTGISTSTTATSTTSTSSNTTSTISAPPIPHRVSFLSIFTQVIKNPIVNLTFLGVIWNVAFNGRMPSFLYDLLSSFGSLFPVLAIFLIGVNIYGTFSFQDWGSISIYAYIVLAKILILPVFNYFFTVLLGGSTTLATYAFIVGALPVAPTVSIYALRYTTPTKNYVSSLSAAIVLSTVLGVPLLLIMVVGTMIMEQERQNPTAIRVMINTMAFNLTITALVGVSWVFVSFLFAKRTLKSSYSIIYSTAVIIILRSAMFFIAYHHTNQTAIISTTTSLFHGGPKLLEAIMGVGFNFAHRIWIVLLCVFFWTGRRLGIDAALKLQRRLYIAGLAATILLTLIAAALLALQPSLSGWYLCIPTHYPILSIIQLIFLMPSTITCCVLIFTSRKLSLRDMRVVSIVVPVVARPRQSSTSFRHHHAETCGDPTSVRRASRVTSNPHMLTRARTLGDSTGG